jgi:hypothetical protein
MAGSCTKCGAALTSDTGFCPVCGAPIAAASAQSSAAPIAPPPAAYGAPAAVYAAPPQKSSGALKIILIVIAVVVGLGVVGAAVVGFMGYRALHNAGASFTAGNNAAVSESDLGISAYPGAIHLDQGSMRVKVGNNSMVTSAYTTSDPASSVVSFYQGKLGDNAVVTQTVQGTTLQSATVDGATKDHVLVTVAPNPQGGTRIVIVHESGS